MSQSSRPPGSPPRPLPGSQPGQPAGMGQYVINLKSEEGDEKVSGRRAVYEHNVGRTSRFQEKLRHWLDERGLSPEVAGIGEPMGFAIVTLTTTAAVADQIAAAFPEIESVFRDDDFLGFRSS